MSPAELEETLTDIFRTLFRQPQLELTDSLTARNVSGWDSLNHVNLVLQVEEEFGIKFRSVEVARLANVGELKALIRSKLDA